MFEPQDHPDDIPYPGGPPTPPYDNAGWTLAFQMGVKFDRVLEAFDGPFERIDSVSHPPRAQWSASERPPDISSAIIRTTRSSPSAAAAAGRRSCWPRDRRSAARPATPARCTYPRGRRRARFSRKLAADLGLTFTACRRTARRAGAEAPPGAHRAVGSLRRIELERMDALAARAIRVSASRSSTRRRSTRENLQGRYDVLILTDDARLDAQGRQRRRPDRVPQEYRRHDRVAHDCAHRCRS